MSRESKPCGYTGHMRILNRGVNETKEMFEAQRVKSHERFEQNQSEQHAKKGFGIVYPEVACTCKK